mmetsp:Transcript_79125/g.214055  ORF Transcript_79125/g.214055 Transcript_79125/m.214055 type:complete len:169 (-) Transcript_79125:445-951(-)
MAMGSANTPRSKLRMYALWCANSCKALRSFALPLCCTASRALAAISLHRMRVAFDGRCDRYRWLSWQYSQLLPLRQPFFVCTYLWERLGELQGKHPSSEWADTESLFVVVVSLESESAWWERSGGSDISERQGEDQNSARVLLVYSPPKDSVSRLRVLIDFTSDGIAL